MPDHIDLPDDLRALIEKRGGSDRRKEDPAPEAAARDRRSGADRREAKSEDDGDAAGEAPSVFRI